MFIKVGEWFVKGVVLLAAGLAPLAGHTVATKQCSLNCRLSAFLF